MHGLLFATNALSGSRLAPMRLSPVSNVRMSILEATEGKDVTQPAWALAEIPAAKMEEESAKAFSYLEEIGGYDVEMGGRPWDPLNLATETTTGTDVQTRLRWFRQAEIKQCARGLEP